MSEPRESEVLFLAQPPVMVLIFAHRFGSFHHFQANGTFSHKERGHSCPRSRCAAKEPREALLFRIPSARWAEDPPSPRSGGLRSADANGKPMNRGKSFIHCPLMVNVIGYRLSLFPRRSSPALSQAVRVSMFNFPSPLPAQRIHPGISALDVILRKLRPAEKRLCHVLPALGRS